MKEEITLGDIVFGIIVSITVSSLFFFAMWLFSEPTEDLELQKEREIFKNGYMRGQRSILLGKPDNFKVDSLEFEILMTK